MPFQGGVSGLHHHLFSQLFRDTACLRLPAQFHFIIVLLICIDLLQPQAEGLVHRKVELCTDRAADIFIFVSGRNGNILRQIPHTLCCFFAVIDLSYDALLPFAAQFVQQPCLKGQAVAEGVVHKEIFIAVLHPGNAEVDPAVWVKNMQFPALQCFDPAHNARLADIFFFAEH